jgi:hypothetical protein
MTLTPKDLVAGERYKWKDQPERLVNDGEDSMSKQPEALRLADALDYYRDYNLSVTHTGIDEQAAAELRRLHDVELHLAQVERGFDKLITQRDALHSVNSELLDALKLAQLIVNPAHTYGIAIHAAYRLRWLKELIKEFST